MGNYTVHERATLLRDAVFSANDGIITTFAVIAGARGASLSLAVVLIMGFANLFADAWSMASGNFLGMKSEIDYQNSNSGGKKVTEHSPFRHGLVTYTSFVIAGFFPLVPYIFRIEPYFGTSVAIVIFVLFVVGVFRGHYSKKSYVISGLETLVIGGFAALVAYGVGFLVDVYVI